MDWIWLNIAQWPGGSFPFYLFIYKLLFCFALLWFCFIFFFLIFFSCFLIIIIFFVSCVVCWAQADGQLNIPSTSWTDTVPLTLRTNYLMWMEVLYEGSGFECRYEGGDCRLWRMVWFMFVDGTVIELWTSCDKLVGCIFGIEVEIGVKVTLMLSYSFIRVLY